MTANEIRKQFIDFFKAKQHTFVPSAPVIPRDDPTLLFTNAGMNQFKDVFLDKGSRPYSRAVNAQKCIRVSGKHNDLEEVGRDTYHHTFFEMLGNWSFGDYYKKEAILWAWELLTDVWQLPKDKLYATVYTTDDEAAGLWARVTDIKADHILRFGEKENFWEMGSTGPCGPCSEIHIDLGAQHCDKQGEDHLCGVNGDCGRYIELWNLVFIQYNRDESGKLHPLSKKHVDTGAGFERLVAVLQHKFSNYDTDVFLPIMDYIGQLTGQPYATSGEQTAFRVIADHIRMLTFSIADGGIPSNDGRGYVMRRILRRAARYARKLDIREPFIFKIVPKVVELMGDAYPEIRERQDHIMAVIRAEEEHFNRTLDRGLEIFGKIKSELKSRNQIVIPGEEVFRLYDTYGFPVDLTRILAEEEGLTLDMKGFDQAMELQRERARSASRFEAQASDSTDWVVLNEGEDSKFVGYNDLAIETHIMRYVIEPQQIKIILRETPFYAESGGQIGDRGTLSGEGFELQVTDTQKDGDHIVHYCRPLASFSPKTDKVLAEVTVSRRRETAKNHTATHLLHAALRKVLGAHLTQAGSLVEPDRLRFDFTHFERISEEDLEAIEKIVNDRIQQDIALEIAQEKYTDAKQKGAMALFGEKYGDVVRTVKVGTFSLELCGGTHVNRTGEIGPFIIVSESGIAAGVRRIEAITGPKAVEYLQQNRTRVQKLAALMNTRPEELVAKTEQLVNDKRQLEKELNRATRSRLNSDLDGLFRQAESINDIKVLIHGFEGIDGEQLKSLGDRIRERGKQTAALLYSETDGKLTFVCAVSDDLIKNRKLSAGTLVREVARAAHGGGGGRPHLATAGAKDASHLKEALDTFREQIGLLK